MTANGRRMRAWQYADGSGDAGLVAMGAWTPAGAVHNDRSSPSFSRCLFAGNSASGGGSGGGLFVQAGSLPTFTDCAFTGNVAAFNGRGLFTNDRAVLTNCTFAGNQAGPSGAGGGIAVFAGASPALTSCILWGNNDGGGMDESAQIHVDSGAPTVSYSCVQGLDTFAGSGNIGDDPRFVDPAGGDGIAGTTDDDLRLRPDSPAIDTGDPDFAAEPGAMDLDGHARVLCDRVDMGGYEFGIGDADCDRDVDVDDYLLWTLCMLGPAGGPYIGGCEVFDFDLDGHVDLGDFAGFQDLFGQ